MGDAEDADGGDSRAPLSGRECWANLGEEVSRERLDYYLKELADLTFSNGGTRDTDGPAYYAAADRVDELLTGLGFRVGRESPTKYSGDTVWGDFGDASQPVVMLGAHLDSVYKGPGINDNASGCAALLALAEAATRCGPSKRFRVAFWASEEQYLWGSSGWVKNNPHDDIVVYVNADMLGSRNGVPFITQRGAGARKFRLAVEQRFLRLGLPSPPSAAVERNDSDYASFKAVGIPTLDFHTGAGKSTKTEAEAQAWGGTAGKYYDSCYHKACDDESNVDHDQLEFMTRALGESVGWWFAAPGVGDSPLGPPRP